MLQRIQSIWLLLASACAFLSLNFPFYTGNYTDSKNFTTFESLNGLFSIPLILVTAAIGIIALVCIFLYKNRKLQFRLTLICIVLEALLIFLYYSKAKEFVNGAYALTALLQGCIIFFLFLAARGINHDEKIVKDSNRLR
ncbi:MAG: DUF4293 domain-containing protein [Ferruginibacter sp.]